MAFFLAAVSFYYSISSVFKKPKTLLTVGSWLSQNLWSILVVIENGVRPVQVFSGSFPFPWLR